MYSRQCKAGVVNKLKVVIFYFLFSSENVAVNNVNGATRFFRAGRDRDGLHGGRVFDGHAGPHGGLQGDAHRLRLQGDLAGPRVYAPPVPSAPGHQERQRSGTYDAAFFATQNSVKVRIFSSSSCSFFEGLVSHLGHIVGSY